MKIAVMGTESNSVHLAPFGDSSWKIWGCSPGLYPIVPRVDAWFELHRWEPPVIGQAGKQVPWFTPEYVAWMGMLPVPVWMYARVPEVRNSIALPVADLTKKYGFYFFTSSIAWMLAMAIDTIEADREARAKARTAARSKMEELCKSSKTPMPVINEAAEEPDCIGLWGVDMSAEEEYMWQRPGCHFFITLAHARGIRLVVPEESDILCPPPLYAISESWHRQIKFLARTKMMQQRQRMVDASQRNLADEVAFLKGALQDNEYHRRTWIHDQDVTTAHLEGIMAGKHIFEEPMKVISEAAIAASSVSSAAAAMMSAAGKKLDAADAKARRFVPKKKPKKRR